MSARLTACPSDKTMIGGVNACGKVWSLGSGQATSNADGKLTVDLHGLVLNDASVGSANGSPDGVDAVAVALVCDGTVAAQTQPVVLRPKGDARIEAQLQVPKPCSAPRIIVRERYEGRSAVGSQLPRAMPCNRRLFLGGQPRCFVLGDQRVDELVEFAQ